MQQVERHIFSGKNHNTRSIQLFIDALNELRHCDVLAHMKLGGEYKNRRVNAKVENACILKFVESFICDNLDDDDKFLWSLHVGDLLNAEVSVYLTIDS